MNRGEIRNVLSEFNEAVIHHAGRGVPVQMEGLGIFITLNSIRKVNLRRGVRFRKALNVERSFHAKAINSENIRKTSDELVDIWNEEHPDDQVIS